MSDNPEIVMVSSAVYDIEELLESLYALLTGFGYEVWMSHKGTIPIDPEQSCLDNCLCAVEKCDKFLGIITPRYGSGMVDDLSFTHYEILKAIELNKPRWFLAHDHVVAARLLLRNLGYKTAAQRAGLVMERKPPLEDVRIIDMYEAAILHDIQLKDRTGNWVQKFRDPDDALLFASTQFYRYAEAAHFVRSNFESANANTDPSSEDSTA